MKTFYISLICLFFLQVSCKKSNVVKKYYSSGNLFSEIEYDKNGIKNGIAKKYFENGNLMQIAKYAKGEIIDTTFVFYENGNKKSKIIFRADTVYSKAFYKNEILEGVGKFIKKSKIKFGWWKYFDEQGNLSQKIEFVENNSKPNQLITYDSQQNINKNKSYFYLINSPKTAKIKTEIPIGITYNSPYQENSEIYIVLEKQRGDRAYKDSVKMLYNPIQVNLKLDKLGVKSIKGYFLEYYEDIFENPNADSASVKERKMYFNKEIVVLGD